MMTKTEKVAQLKKEYPTLKVGNDDDGYTELDSAEYESTISQWADSQLAMEKEEAEQAAKQAALESKLAKLGLTLDDLKGALL